MTGTISHLLACLVLPVLLAFSSFAQQADNPVTAPDTNASSATNSSGAKSTILEEGATNTNAEANGTGENDRGEDANYRGPLVVFGRNAELRVGDSAEAVVILWGSARVRGNVRESVVTICGDATVDGDVRSVVSILGNIKINPGAKVHDQVVAVGGDINADARVGQEVVAVLGDVKAGSAAHLGEVTAIGGTVESEPGAVLDRQPVQVDFRWLSLSLRKYLRYCVLELRPLAPQVGWVWVIAAFFFFIYFIIALFLPNPVRACVGVITRRPITTLFMGLLTKILTPVLLFILVATGVGVFVVPFVVIAMVIGAFIGKVALFEALGGILGRRFELGVLQKPLAAFLVGIILITLLYMVPVLGLFTLVCISLWGMGTAVLAAVGGLRKEAPLKTIPISPTTPTDGPAAGSVPSGTATEFATAGPSESPGVTQPGTAPSVPSDANLPEAYSHPRATFWLRMGAAFLDVILVGMLSIVVHGPPLGFLVMLAYFGGMWAWKGTTVGGIVVGLKVVRLDGQRISFLVSLVRALAAAFSVIVFFLGFLWIIWDKEKQSWHDKISGTVVIKTPRSVPLVCL